jgi:hypothetical protein
VVVEGVEVLQCVVDDGRVVKDDEAKITHGTKGAGWRTRLPVAPAEGEQWIEVNSDAWIRARAPQLVILVLGWAAAWALPHACDRGHPNPTRGCRIRRRGRGTGGDDAVTELRRRTSGALLSERG